MKRMNQTKFEALYAHYEQSKLSVKQFCAEAGISIGVFHHWRKKIQIQQESALQSTVVVAGEEEIQEPMLRPITLVETITPLVETTSKEISISLPNGICVQVELGSQQGALREVLTQLAQIYV